jgi:hypothetical protein
MRGCRWPALGLLFVSCGGRSIASGPYPFFEQTAGSGGKATENPLGGQGGAALVSGGSAGDHALPAGQGGSAGKGGGESAGAGGAPGGAAGVMNSQSGAGGSGGLGGRGGEGGRGGVPGDRDYVPTGEFEPDEVLLWGTLAEGACYRDALARLTNPNQAEVGFSCDSSGRETIDPTRGTFVRPGDGRLVFLRGGGVRVFVPDGNGTYAYPESPHDNDLPIPTACAVERLLMDPGTSGIVYTCDPLNQCATKGCTYYDESGDAHPVPMGYYIVAVGYDGLALVAVQSEVVALLEDGNLRELERPLSGVAIRAHGDGFWALTGAASGTAPARLFIAPDGSVTLEGEYPEPPSGSFYSWPATEGDWSKCAFEAGGAALCFGGTPNPLNDQILRSELDDDEAAVVYEEATFPLVKVHISHLVTAP